MKSATSYFVASRAGIEGCGGLGLMFPRMRARIEAAAPFPRIGVVRIPDAFGNRPDMNIAVVDVPALLAMCGSATGEGGHAVLKRDSAG